MSLSRRSIVMAAALALSAGLCLSAQAPQLFTFVVSVTDGGGAPVGELRAEDVIMSENGVSQPVIKVEPHSVPIKLTIAVDNGRESIDAIEYFRAGLKGLVEALPPDVETALISFAPQPRNVVKATADREQILRGINSFAPENAGPHFTDVLMEYGDRLKREAKDSKATPYLPVLLIVSTIAGERTQYQPKQIQETLTFMATRRARVNTIVAVTRPGDVKTAASLDSSWQAIVGKQSAQMTGGRFETLSTPNRLATLLPEWGRDLATLHTRQARQFRVTVERERSGQLQNPKIDFARAGLNATVTQDGYLP
jgi:hypothetical protein